jgi:hypothetical protein
MPGVRPRLMSRSQMSAFAASISRFRLVRAFKAVTKRYGAIVTMAR